jgi:hypothetical protein
LCYNSIDGFYTITKRSPKKLNIRKCILRRRIHAKQAPATMRRLRAGSDFPRLMIRCKYRGPGCRVLPPCNHAGLFQRPACANKINLPILSEFPVLHVGFSAATAYIYLCNCSVWCAGSKSMSKSAPIHLLVFINLPKCCPPKGNQDRIASRGAKTLSRGGKKRKYPAFWGVKPPMADIRVLSDRF